MNSLQCRRLKLYCLALLPIAVLLLTGCAKSNNGNDGVKYLIGVSQANMIEPWRIAMTDEIKKEALNQKDCRIVLTDAAQNSQKQIRDVKELMEEGIDLLIISPNESEALTPIVTEVYSKIPVIVLDRAIEGYNNYSLYIGPDNNLIGKNAGQFIADLLGEKGGNIIEIQGLSGSPPVRDRSQGFREVINQHDNITIIDTIRADWMKDTAEDKMRTGIAKYPDVDVIFAQNDPMAYGAYQATKDLGIDNIKIVGVDGLQGSTGGLELVKQGILVGTFTCAIGGKEAIQYALDILNHESGIPKKIILRSKEITKSNVNEYLEAMNTGTVPKAINDRNIVLGFAQCGEESSWRLANSTSIKEAALASGIDLKFVNANSDQQKQIKAIRDFIQQKVDVIAFSPLVETGWEEVLKEAKNAGIPVICSDRTVKVEDDSLYTTYLGGDFVEEGRRAARWLVEKMGRNMPVNIVELQGTLGSAPTIDRKAGFDEIIKEYTNYRIISSESAEFRKQTGKEVMAGILKSENRNIDVVFSHNDDMALGAIEAMEEKGIKPGVDIKIVSIDGVKSAFKAMKSGKLNCTVECNPLLGPQLMKAVRDTVSGKQMPIRIITDEAVYPEETAKSEYPNRTY